MHNSPVHLVLPCFRQRACNVVVVITAIRGVHLRATYSRDDQIVTDSPSLGRQPHYNKDVSSQIIQVRGKRKRQAEACPLEMASGSVRKVRSWLFHYSGPIFAGTESLTETFLKLGKRPIARLRGDAHGRIRFNKLEN